MKLILLFFIITTLNAHANDRCENIYLNFDNSKLKECSEQEKFYERFKDYKIYLGFASPYVKNPASIFGHNFILVSKDQNTFLGGFTVSFEGQNNSSNMFQYVFRGLTGDFVGRYFIKPTYNSISLYNNFEDRNLYIYPLKLGDNHRKKILLKILDYHKYKSRRYYFFNGNCAYYIYDFIIHDKISKKRPLVYFSPQDTIRKLSHVIDFKNVIVLPSIKSEIKNISLQGEKNQKEIINYYKKAKFEIYKEHRGEANTHRLALIELNQKSLKSKSRIPEYKLLYSDLLLSPYTNISFGHDLHSKYSFAISIINNTYREINSISQFEFISFHKHNFNQNEYEFILFKVDSKSDFEWYFKDISWKSEMRYLKSNYLDLSSKDFLLGAGLTISIFKNFLITVKEIFQASDTSRSSYIKFYPEIELDYSFKKFSFSCIYSKKYFLNSLDISINQNIYNNFLVFLSYEHIEKFRENVSLNFTYRF